jgi:hypothetical protein
MSLMKPKSGMFKRFHGINSLISPVDESKYRELLPEQFDAHDSPQASAFVVHYQTVHPWPMTSYHEGAIFLKCVYEDKEYWYTYTMPVTKYVPMWGGRRMGFPKYLADSISLVNKDESWEGAVTHQGRTKLSLRFDPGLRAEPGPSEEFVTNQKDFFFGNGINLLPPSKGPKVITIDLLHQVEPSWNPRYGMVRMDCDKAEKHYGLFDIDKEYFGFYNEFNGGINLDPIRLR